MKQEILPKAKRSIVWRLSHAILIRFSPVFMYRSYIEISDLFYSASNLLLTEANASIHPKHDIMKYEEFFLRFIKQTDLVIDLGAGTGFVASKIAQHAKWVTAIEISAKKIKLAKERHPSNNIDFINCDIFDYKYDKIYDVCILSNVLEHISDRIGLLTKIYNISNSLLIRVPAIDRDWQPLWRKKNNIEWRTDETHYVEYLQEELEEELFSCGWKIDVFERKWGEFYVRCIKGESN